MQLDNLIREINKEGYFLNLSQDQDGWSCLVWKRLPRAFQGRGFGRGLTPEQSLTNAISDTKKSRTVTPYIPAVHNWFSGRKKISVDDL